MRKGHPEQRERIAREETFCYVFFFFYISTVKTEVWGKLAPLGKGSQGLPPTLGVLSCALVLILIEEIPTLLTAHQTESMWQGARRHPTYLQKFCLNYTALG